MSLLGQQLANQMYASQGAYNQQLQGVSTWLPPDPWVVKIRKAENGYVVMAGNKEYLCADGADLGDTVKQALVLNKITG